MFRDKWFGLRRLRLDRDHWLRLGRDHGFRFGL
jgi:hypothetical protein